MERKAEKIKKFSKVVCTLLNITIFVYIAIGAMALLAWIFTLINLPVEVVSINGTDMEVIYLFKLGDTGITLPFIWHSDPGFWGVQRLSFGFSYAIGFGYLLGVFFFIISLFYAKRVFELLYENSSPFRDSIVVALKRLSVALLITGCVVDISMFLLAGMVWALCLIFDYGYTLQNESDTTL